MTTYKLPYMPIEVNEVQTPYGFPEVIGIDNYIDASLRGKVVFRVDTLYSISELITEDTISKYRMLLYNLISGNNRDKQAISKIFQALYFEDEKFRVFLGEKVYFDNLEEKSLYTAIMTSLHTLIKTAESRIIEEFNFKNIKYIASSKCFIYAAVSDVSMTVSVPKGFREELVSRAKVWKGNFSEY